MASNVQTLLSSLLLLATAVAAFDVKQILDPYPEFSSFTKYLTDTKLTDDINAQQTVTVLVVDNSAVGPLASVPTAQLKDALSVHVLLDYYDPYIFDRNKTGLVTTLFQSSGRAANGNGFLNYTQLPGEQVMIGSAAPGAPLDSEILKVVGAKPYNLSVLQVSKAIVPPGIGGGASQDPSTNSEKAATPVPSPTATPATPAAAPPKVSGGATPAASPPKPSGAATPTAPAGPPKASADAPEKASTGGPAAPAETPSEGAAAPAEGPASSSASGPAATDAPTESNSTPAENADAPASDAGEANAVSSAMRVAVGATMGTAMAVAVAALL